MAQANRCTFCARPECQPLIQNDPMSDAAPAAIGEPCVRRAVRELFGVELRVKTYTVVRAVKAVK